MDIQSSKLELIKLIADIESERLIEKLKNFLQREVKNGTNGAPAQDTAQEPEPEWIRLAREPMPEVLDLEKYQREQGYGTEKLFETLRNLDRDVFADESLEELLKTLTK